MYNRPDCLQIAKASQGGQYSYTLQLHKLKTIKTINNGTLRATDQLEKKHDSISKPKRIMKAGADQLSPNRKGENLCARGGGSCKKIRPC